MDTTLAVPALSIASTEVDDTRARIDALNDEAWALRFADHARAEALAREALELAEGARYDAGIALALRTLGVQQSYFHSDYEGALEQLQRAFVLLDKAGKIRGRADVLNGIGSVRIRLGEYPEATRLHLQALEIQRGTADVVGECNSLNHLGYTAFLVGDYASALEYHQASLALREQTGSPGIGHSLVNIGSIHGQLGAPERVLEYMRRAIGYLEHDDPQAALICLVNTGSAYAAMGRYDLALEHYERAASGFRAIDHVDEANCLIELGRIHESLGNHASARAQYQRALEMVRRLDGHIYEPEILLRLGGLQAAQGETVEGFAHLHEALDLAERQGARQHVYAAHEALAAAYEAAGDTGRALEHHRAFHSVWREVFGTETNLRIQNARVRAEVQQTQREAEILRERNEALARADEEKSRLLDQLRIQAAELERQTREDALTGVFNRRHMDALLAGEWERALRFGRPLSVAMMDVDHFKSVNDRFTHAAGDEVLRTVARILRDHTRGVDVVARYGGEEFCLILVETRLDEAARLCERLRGLVEAYDWSAIRPGLSVTISAGVAGLHEANAPDTLLAAADLRLYSAKHAGRNRVRAS